MDMESDDEGKTWEYRLRDACRLGIVTSSQFRLRRRPVDVLV